MSADKLEAVREALADVFNESNLNATKTSDAAFDHKTLSEAFSEPHLNAANTEQSFARFEHAALTGMFGEPSTEKPPPTSFDQSFAQILSERPPHASDIHQPRPGFDHQGFAEILSEPPSVSTNTKPSQPSFDHQALAEMLTESHADPINPPTSPLGFQSSSATFSGQMEHEEPVAKAFTASPPTNAEGARPPRAKSLLAKLHHMFSTKEEPLLANVEKVTLPPSLSGQQHTPEPIAKSISTFAEDAVPQPVDTRLAELSPLSFEPGPVSPLLASRSDNARATGDVVATFSTDSASAWSPLTALPPLPLKVAELPPLLETEPSQAILAGQSDFTAAPTDAESAGARHANSLPVELPPLNPIVSKIGPPIRRETSDATLTGQPDHLESAAELAAAPPTDTEPARPQQAEPYLVEVPLLISTDIETSLPNFQREPSPPTVSGRSESTASTASTVTPFPPTNTETAPRQRLSWLLAELAPTVSANPKPPLATSEKERSTSFEQFMNLEPEEKSASVASLTKSESAVMPAQTKRVLGESLPLHSTDTEPQPFIFEHESSPIIDSGQPDRAEPAAEIVAAAPLSETEDARTKRGGSILADLPPSHSYFERKPSPAIFSEEVDKVRLAEETAAATSPPHAAAAQQTKSPPLTDLPDLPDLASTDSKSSFPGFKQGLLSSSLSGQPDSVGPPVNPVGAAGATEAESPRPQPISSLLTALRVLTGKPSTPVLQKEASHSTLAGQPDNAVMSVETVAQPTDAERALAPQTKSLLTEMPALVSTDAKSPAPIFEKEPSRPPISDQPVDAAPTAKAVAVDPPTDTESAVTRAQHAKSLLDGLDLNTAIHLRWVMRDIRSKRTKFSPVSSNDLTTLVDLGLVEIREELPRLTGLGFLALDRA
jgi:hypothetical protein